MSPEQQSGNLSLTEVSKHECLKGDKVLFCSFLDDFFLQASAKCCIVCITKLQFVNSAFIHLVKKTERNVVGQTHRNAYLFIFLTNPNSECNKSACLINKILLLVKYSHALNSCKVNFTPPTV